MLFKTVHISLMRGEESTQPGERREVERPGLWSQREVGLRNAAVRDGAWK